MSIEEIITARFPDEKTQSIADDLGLTYSQVVYRASILGLKKSDQFKNSILSGRKNVITVGKDTRFKKGNIAHNKGKKMSENIYQKIKPTMFKKGNRPMNWKPDGTIVQRADKTGRIYLYYKIKDNFWVLYHRKIWEDQNGKIPKGLVLKFKDGNSLNCDIQNLELISMVDNMQCNTIMRFPEDVQELIRLNNKLKRKIDGKKQDK